MDSSHRIRAILAFVNAADTGSFAGAGRSLGLTSAAISKSVATLEKALGVRLMNRTTRALKLTDEGVAFLRQARVALDALDTAVDAVAQHRAEPAGRVHITTSAAFGQEFLMPALPGLLSRHAGLSFQVDFDDRVVDLVGGGYDLALRGGHIRDSALISRTVCRLRTVLVASPDYLARHGSATSPAALAQHRLIARRFLGGAVATWSFQAVDGSITTLDPAESAILILTAPEALVRAACDGIGIAQVAAHLAWEHLRTGRLRVVLHDKYLPSDFEMVLQYPHRALIPPRVRVTVEHLLEAFSADRRLHIEARALAAYVA